METKELIALLVDINGWNLIRDINNFDIKKKQKEIDIAIEIKSRLEGRLISEKMSILKDLEQQYDIENERILTEKAIKNQNAYKEKLKKDEAKGIIFKDKVQVGDIIKVSGTRDGKGHRLVLEKREWDVICQKLNWLNKSNTFKKDNYITEHYWSKVIEILYTAENAKNILK